VDIGDINIAEETVDWCPWTCQ